MKEKPDIVKKIEEEEKLGLFQSQVQSSYNEMSTSEEIPEDTTDETIAFFEDDLDKDETISNIIAADSDNQNMFAGEDIYRLIFENVQDEIILINRYGKVIEVNQRIEDIYGFKREDIIGKHVTKLGMFGLKELPMLIKYFKNAVKGKTINPLELKIKHKDGHVIPVEVSTCSIIKNDKTIVFMSIVKDITKRKLQEEHLQRISNAIENTSDGVGIFDISGKIIFQNKALVKLIGYTVEELNAAGGHTAIFDDKEISNEMFSSIMGGNSWSEEVKLRNNNGKLIDIFLRADAIKNEIGKII